MWLDARASSADRALGSLGFSRAQHPDEQPDVKAMLKELLAGLREKFNTIGMPAPQGKIVDAVIVEEQWREAVLENVKDLGIPVYTAARDTNGVKLPGGAFFVCDANTQLPMGALEPPPIQFSTTARLTAQSVWSLVPVEESPEEVAAAKEAMDRYKEGLDNEGKYVVPPKSRMKELMGLSSDEGCLPVKMGQVLATTMPPNPVLWARALVQRRKDAGSGVPSYRLKSDREAVSPQ